MIRLACHLDTYFHRGGQGLISSVGSFSAVGGSLLNFHCGGGVEAGDSRFFWGVPDSFCFHDSFLIRYRFVLFS